MRRSEQDASMTRRIIMQLHRPAKLKLRRTQVDLRPLVLWTGGLYFLTGKAGGTLWTPAVDQRGQTAGERAQARTGTGVPVL